MLRALVNEERLRPVFVYVDFVWSGHRSSKEELYPI